VTILLSASLIVGMLLANRFGWDMGRTLAWSVSVSGLLQMAVCWIAVRRAGYRLPFRWPHLTPELKRLAIIAAPAVLAGGVVQVNLIVGRQVASATEGAMTWLFYADRLYQLPLGVVGIAIGIVLLPELSRRLRAEDHDGARMAYNRGTEFALLLTLPAAVALVVIAWPIISVIYQRGAFGADAALATSQALAAYALGLPAFVLQKVLQPLYYAREDTRSPFRFALWSMVVNAALAVGLMPLVGFLAAAIATSASAWVMVWQLWRGTKADGRRGALRRPLPRPPAPHRRGLGADGGGALGAGLGAWRPAGGARPAVAGAIGDLPGRDRRLLRRRHGDRRHEPAGTAGLSAARRQVLAPPQPSHHPAPAARRHQERQPEARHEARQFGHPGIAAAEQRPEHQLDAHQHPDQAEGAQLVAALGHLAHPDQEGEGPDQPVDRRKHPDQTAPAPPAEPACRPPPPPPPRPGTPPPPPTSGTPRPPSCPGPAASRPRTAPR
jgi:hypothetical protein